MLNASRDIVLVSISDSYLQNELNQALDSPVPHTSNSASSQSQGPNRGTGTTTGSVMKTPTQPQSNTLPLDMSTTPGSKQFQLPTRSALSIDVHIPHTADSPPSSQQGVNPPGPAAAVNDNTRPNLANEAAHNSNNVVFDVTMGIQDQRKQPNALRSQEATLSKRSSTQTVTSGTFDPTVNSGQNTASHLSTVDAGFVSMSGGGTTQSRPSAQGHSHQRRFMTLDGIKTLQQGTSNTQAGTPAGEGHDTKALELQSNVNADGISHDSSQQDSSATTGTASVSFSSQDVGGAQMDPNQHSGGTNAMTSEMNTIPINAYTSRPLMDTNAGTFFDRTSLIASVANRIPSDIFTTQKDVQSSDGASLLTAAMAAAATYERTSTGAPQFNQGLDSVSFNRQPISKAAHQKIVGAQEFYQQDSRYLDGDQGESEGQEMSQNMVNINPLLLHFGVSKERQMSPHDSQQFLSNSERSDGYSEYSPMTSFPLI